MPERGNDGVMKRRLGGSVCAAALVLAACGSSGSKADPAKDLKTAKAATLTSADLPAYSATPYQPSGDVPAAVKKRFAECVHEPTTVFDDTPGAQKAHSPDFRQREHTISATVEIDPKRSDIDKGWSQLSKPGIEPCLEQLFESAVKLSAPDATFANASATRFNVGVGDRSVGYEIKMDVTTQGETAPADVNLLYVARDRAGIDLIADNIGQPLDHASEIALVRKMYDRVGTKAA